ncbi:hypothetical protein [Paenibacillus sp. IHBB 3054]|uniref:hypothetical protein n=1 Tax=Paenibacillus sp. IHBB 3054 TaxID=3425689 RepID=UPI003F671645
MHNLRIEGRKIFLDGFEVKGVNGYELTAEGPNGGTEVTIRLSIDDVQIKPKQSTYVQGGIVSGDTLAIVGHGDNEKIIPIEGFNIYPKCYFGTEVSIKGCAEQS